MGERTQYFLVPYKMDEIWKHPPGYMGGPARKFTLLFPISKMKELIAWYYRIRENQVWSFGSPGGTIAWGQGSDPGVTSLAWLSLTSGLWVATRMKVVSILFKDRLSFALALFTWGLQSMVLYLLSHELQYNQELNKCLLNQMVVSLIISGYANINVNEFLIGGLAGSVKTIFGSKSLILKAKRLGSQTHLFSPPLPPAPPSPYYPWWGVNCIHQCCCFPLPSGSCLVPETHTVISLSVGKRVGRENGEIAYWTT